MTNTHHIWFEGVQLTLALPEGADQFIAAVFTQHGEWVHSGHREECEDMAQNIGGLYCWLDRGRAILRRDYTPDV